MGGNTNEKESNDGAMSYTFRQFAGRSNFKSNGIACVLLKTTNKLE